MSEENGPVYIEASWERMNAKPRVVYRVKQDGHPGAAGPYKRLRQARKIAAYWIELRFRVDE